MFWAVRFAYRHRHVIPYIDVALGTLGTLIALVVLAMIIGDKPALILTPPPPGRRGSCATASASA